MVFVSILLVVASVTALGLNHAVLAAAPPVKHLAQSGSKMDRSRTVGQDIRGSRRLYQLCCDRGFSAEKWQRRVMRCDQINTAVGISATLTGILSFELMVCGSFSEGMADAILGSDIDIVRVFAGTTVRERNSEATGQRNYSLEERDHLFETIPSRHPAFVRLQFVDVGNRRDEDDSFVMTPDYCRRDKDGRFVLSSSEMRRSIGPEGNTYTGPSTEHGPAQTSTMRIEMDSGDFDIVLGLRCDFWPNVSSNWINRQRAYNWPTDEMIRKIVSHGCEVVPVGDLMSPFQDTEWRLSSSVAEKTLIRSFNIVQIQCYFLLKMTLVYLIKPQVPHTLCSYHIKNLMLYAVEETDPREWTEDNLACCFEQCLRKLHGYLQDGYCPHYFIPEQNLFDPKVQGDPRRRLVEIVGELMTSGWQCVLRCAPFLSTTFDCDIPRSQEDAFKVLKMQYILFSININTLQNHHPKLLSTNVHDAVSYAIWKLNTIPDEANAYYPCSQTTRTLKKMIRSSLGYMLLAVTRGKRNKNTKTPCAILRVAQQFLEEASDVDMAAGRLKLATFFYQTGRARKCVQIVRDVIRDYTDATATSGPDTVKGYAEVEKTQFLRSELQGLLPMIHDREGLARPGALFFSVLFSPWEIPSAPPGVQALALTRPTTYERALLENLIVIHPLVYAHYLLVISNLDLGNHGYSRQSLGTLRQIVEHPRRYKLYYKDVARQLYEHCIVQLSLHDQ